MVNHKTHCTSCTINTQIGSTFIDICLTVSASITSSTKARVFSYAILSYCDISLSGRLTVHSYWLFLTHCAVSFMLTWIGITIINVVFTTFPTPSIITGTVVPIYKILYVQTQDTVLACVNLLRLAMCKNVHIRLVMMLTEQFPWMQGAEAQSSMSTSHLNPV